jgi:WD40 repeat protein
LAKERCMVNDMALSLDKKKLAVLWDESRDDVNQSHASIWNWPTREQQVDVPLPDGFYQRIGWVPGSEQFAICDGNTGITFFDARSGKRLAKLGGDETRLLTFTPDGKHLLTTEEYRLTIWEVQSKKKLKQLDLDCNELAISPNGKYLAAVTSRDALVWRVEDLLR